MEIRKFNWENLELKQVRKYEIVADTSCLRIKEKEK